MPKKGNSKLSMHLEERIIAFVKLGQFLGQFSSEITVEDKYLKNTDIYLDGMLQKLEAAKNNNGWFTPKNMSFACKSWSKVLSETNLKKWVSLYALNKNLDNTIAVIMAGNVPLVGFHDFLSVLISGNKVLAKLSSNDKVLLPYLAEFLIEVEPKFEDRILFTEEKLENFDAVIATGSNNTGRYFDYYFGKYPHIIRKNRNSVAVLTGNETPKQMEALADDVFRYFGLGCRNVSKIFVPEGYNFDSFFNGMFSWKDIINNNKYVNNYDYNKAVYLMSSFELLDNEFLLLKQDKSFSSPISVVFYETYKNLDSLKNTLALEKENIQCIVSQARIKNEVDFGETQAPQLWEYADGIDTLDFLLKLS